VPRIIRLIAPLVHTAIGMARMLPIRTTTLKIISGLTCPYSLRVRTDRLIELNQEHANVAKRKKITQGGTIRNYKSGDWLRSAIQQKTLNPDVVKTGSEVRRNISADGPKNIYSTEKSLLSDSAIKSIRDKGGSKGLKKAVSKAKTSKSDVGRDLLQEATPGGGVGRKPRMPTLRTAPDRQTYPTVDVRGSKPQARSVQTSTATGGKDTNVQLKSDSPRKPKKASDFLAGTEYEDLRY
jgi:hypothetical protein